MSRSPRRSAYGPLAFARLACAALLWSALAGGALAQQPANDEPRNSDEKRPLPDYDGRDEPTTAGDVLIWIPRIALSPLYVVSELVVRRPLGWLLTAAERAHVPEALFDVFTIGPDHQGGVIPIAFIDFGFDPSVGLYAFWDDAFVDGHDLRLRASTWGAEWLAASASDRWQLSDDHQLAFDFTAVRRPDYTFYGIGPRSRETDVARYGATRLDGRSSYDIGLWRASRFAIAFGARSVSFRRGHYDQDPTLGEQVGAGRYPTPDGYQAGYTAVFERMSVALDSRQSWPAAGSGVRVEAEVEQESDVRHSPGTGFVRYGGGLAGFYDLNERGRVVGLGVRAAFADPLGARPIPFSELRELGGSQDLRGFVPGRLLGRSSAVATLHYRWPIWVLLDGSIQLSVGNVFGARLRDFEPELLRFSGAIGVESVGSPDSSLELLLGIGSEPFAEGGEIESIRFAVGTNHGF